MKSIKLRNYELNFQSKICSQHTEIIQLSFLTGFPNLKFDQKLNLLLSLLYLPSKSKIEFHEHDFKKCKIDTFKF